MSNYYDGTKLLSLSDINGNKPEIYLCTSNRTAGKTTYFGRLCVNRFKDKKEKFALVYRFKYELDSVHEKFFKDIAPLFFPEYVMTSKIRMGGVYADLYINEEHCGYALPLNQADQIKQNSHLFSDIERMLMDEFQSETNHYCSDEVSKLNSIHTSIARGKNKQVRYVPLYMLSNCVTMLNPYFVSLGISDRLKGDTKFLKGDGFVLEQGFNETASQAQKNSGFNRAFANDKYVAYSSENVYLNDNYAFIEKPTTKGRYLATLVYNNSEYAIREYSRQGIVYCDNKADKTFPLKISVTLDDHNINYIMLKNNDFFIKNLRYFFERGCFRFKDLRCKEVIMKTLSYY